MRPKAVWIDPPLGPFALQERILGEAGIDFAYQPCESPADIARAAGDADALMIVLYNYISREVLASLPRCKLVVRHGIGVDNIDVRAATELGVLVSNNPTYCVEEVSDLAMSLLLACARRIVPLNERFHLGQWDTGPARPGHRIQGSTLGLVGLGNVARCVARKAAGFQMRLLAYDPYVEPQAGAGLGVQLVSLAELLQQADYVSVHTPLNSETTHLIGERELQLMKPGAYLVNTARGDIVETQALVKALDEKWIAGAALDVLEGVPPLTAEHALLRFGNVILTPHVAWYSEEAALELQETCARDVVRVLLRGERPLSVVNPQVLTRANCRVASLCSAGARG